RRGLDACPDAEGRPLPAPCRLGGGRPPARPLPLPRGAGGAGQGRVLCPKPDEGHPQSGAGRRGPPLPPPRPPPPDAFARREPGTVFLINRYRDTNATLRTQLARIIRRAGVPPWPKLFQNLRASRETELAAEHPLHVVCAWIGNSALIAQKHYLQVTES